jgi:hypothetical protein
MSYEANDEGTAVILLWFRSSRTHLSDEKPQVFPDRHAAPIRTAPFLSAPSHSADVKPFPICEYDREGDLWKPCSALSPMN